MPVFERVQNASGSLAFAFNSIQPPPKTGYQNGRRRSQETMALVLHPVEETGTVALVMHEMAAVIVDFDGVGVERFGNGER